jgi:hypothetical protein
LTIRTPDFASRGPRRTREENLGLYTLLCGR